MAYVFRLPDIGEGIHEGEILKWFVAEGDKIEEDDVLFEVQNDKAVVEIPSPVTGTVIDILSIRRNSSSRWRCINSFGCARL